MIRYRLFIGLLLCIFLGYNAFGEYSGNRPIENDDLISGIYGDIRTNVFHKAMDFHSPIYIEDVISVSSGLAFTVDSTGGSYYDYIYVNDGTKTFSYGHVDITYLEGKPGDSEIDGVLVETGDVIAEKLFPRDDSFYHVHFVYKKLIFVPETDQDTGKTILKSQFRAHDPNEYFDNIGRPISDEDPPVIMKEHAKYFYRCYYDPEHFFTSLPFEEGYSENNLSETIVRHNVDGYFGIYDIINQSSVSTNKSKPGVFRYGYAVLDKEKNIISKTIFSPKLTTGIEDKYLHTIYWDISSQHYMVYIITNTNDDQYLDSKDKPESFNSREYDDGFYHFEVYAYDYNMNVAKEAFPIVIDNTLPCVSSVEVGVQEGIYDFEIFPDATESLISVDPQVNKLYFEIQFSEEINTYTDKIAGTIQEIIPKIISEINENLVFNVQ